MSHYCNNTVKFNHVYYTTAWLRTSTDDLPFGVKQLDAMCMALNLQQYVT